MMSRFGTRTKKRHIILCFRHPTATVGLRMPTDPSPEAPGGQHRLAHVSTAAFRTGRPHPVESDAVGGNHEIGFATVRAAQSVLCINVGTAC